MNVFLSVFIVFLIVIIAMQHVHWKKRLNNVESNNADRLAELNLIFEKSQGDLQTECDRLLKELKALEPYAHVRDAELYAQEVRQRAAEVLSNARVDAQRVNLAAASAAAASIATAKAEAAAAIATAKSTVINLKNENEQAIKARRLEADHLIASAARQAEDIVNQAKERAEQVAGDAYRALSEAESLKRLAAAMRNVIEGYGDRYLRPTANFLDELADNYGHEDAGRQLRIARERSKMMIERHEAAACDYVEPVRRATAIRFVIDAFNGRVDSIFSRVKSDNFGTLEQQIRDAYALVNHNGAAFRAARILENYLIVRLDELRYAALSQALRERDKEEQRQIREQMREEEKSRREIERALKEAAKEEENIQKAMARIQALVGKANDNQRAAFEAQLAELQAKLDEAEARGKRAMSMAQQTRAGHVYVISNIGSFGEHVYKVGMTRRLEPMDRVKELGDASVPFAFDVHAMIWSDDAPRLESQLHKVFVRHQINKVNPRKEFFRVALTDVRNYLDQQSIKVSWTIAAAAAEYRESLELEKRLADNPVAATQWMTWQMEAADAQEVAVLDVESDT